MSKKRRRQQSLDTLMERPFREELQQPIVVLIDPPQPWMTDTLARRVREEGARAARARKLLLLFEHYNLSFDKAEDWEALMVFLALDLVPGFAVVDKPPPRVGRPRGSTAGDNEALAADIEELALSKSITQRKACAHLVKRKGSPWRGITYAALYLRYERHLKQSCQTPVARMAHLEEQLKKAKSVARGPMAKSHRMHWLEEPIHRIVRGSDDTKIE